MANILNLQEHVVNSSPQDKIWLFYGSPGTRKTTVAMGSREDTLLLAYEIGYKFIPGIYALNMTNWHALKDVLRQLNTIEAKEKYRTIVIDTVGLAYKACISYICALKGVDDIGQIPYGLGYKLSKDEFEKTIGQITQMGYGLIMTAHSDEVVDESAGVSIRVDVDKRPSSVIKGMADFILLARKELRDGTEDKDDVTVYAYSESANPNIEVKSRARFFPKRFEFTYENLINALNQAIVEQDEFFGTQSVTDPNFAVFQETEVNIEAIQNEIKALAEKLASLNLGELVATAIQKHLPNKRITQTGRGDLPRLYAIRDELIELEKNK